MAKKKRPVKHDLDMSEHAFRLRSMPGSSGETMRQVLIWLAAGILLTALGWIAIGR